MPDTHESIRNLNEALFRLSNQFENDARMGQESQFRNKQLAQQGQEMDENRSARAQALAEQIQARKEMMGEQMAGRKAGQAMQFFEKGFPEYQRSHMKEPLQQQLQEFLGSMTPEGRSYIPFGYDKNYKAQQAGLDKNGNPLGQEKGGFDTWRALGIGDGISVPGIGGPVRLRFGPEPAEETMMNQLTPYARARALQMKMNPQQLATEDVRQLPSDMTQGAGSNVGF